jgi:ATP-dependent HslUV protease, peptidase subunit HslV
MSTIVVVKKDGRAVIAADTLTTCGSTKESAAYVVNHQKIFTYKENYLGVSGSASLGLALHSFLAATRKNFSLAKVAEIYNFGLLLHAELKEKHFLRADDDEDFETFRGDILIANKHGIFGLSSYRYVQEYSKFYANGSGGDYALGAMFAVYQNEDKTAEDVARIGVEAGTEFDDGSAAPIQAFTIDQK